MKKIYAEIGFGNDTFLSTEIEQDENEHRIPKFALPQKIQEMYFRFWLFRKVFVFSIPKGISVKTKNRNNFKILFGIGGSGLEGVKKVVIAGSASLQDEISKWKKYWNELDGHSVIAFPESISKNSFNSLYPDVHKTFFENITKTDILFIANEDKNNVGGYIGAETFAELDFGVAQNLLHNKNIKIILAKMPSENVQCFDEIVLWRELGWIHEIKQ